MIDAFTMNRAFGSPREMGESDPGGGALPAGFECDSVAVSWSKVPARAAGPTASAVPHVLQGAWPLCWQPGSPANLVKSTKVLLATPHGRSLDTTVTYPSKSRTRDIWILDPAY